MRKIRVYTSFEDMPAGVREALSYPRQQNFLLSLDWFALLFKTSLRQTLVPRIYVLEQPSGAVEGALFCGVSQDTGPRRLVSLTNFYTLEFSPSVVSANLGAVAAMEEILNYIAAERPRWAVIDFKLLKTDTPEGQAVSGLLGKIGFSSYPFFQFENWYAYPEGKTFDAYYAERASQVKNTISRRQKKLEKTHPFSIKVFTEDSPELAKAILDFVAVYNRSWKQAEPFPDFIPTLVRTCAQLGILRLGVLYVNDKPAASQLWINTPGKAIIYKLAYDEDYRDFGVGSILSKELFRIAIDEDRVIEIDYGVGSEAYKKDWMSSVRTIQGLEAFNRKTLSGIALIGKESLRQPLGAIRKKLSPWLKKFGSSAVAAVRLRSQVSS